MQPNKNRTQSKCRLWEKERRNRLCAAFTALAEILPSTPPTAAKILILQHSIKYIKELQNKNIELEEIQNGKNSENSVLLTEKIMLLEEKCSQLILHIKQAGLSVPSLQTTNKKVVEHVQESPLSIVHDITNQITADDREVQSINKNDALKKSNTEQIKDIQDKDLISILPIDIVDKDEISIEDEDKPSSTKVQKKVFRRTHITKKKRTRRKITKSKMPNVTCSSNLMQKNNTINNVWVTHGSQNGSVLLGNTLLPILPVASPLLMASAQQTPTIFFVQRPPLSNPHNIVKETLSGNSLPLIKQIMPVNNQEKQFQKMYSNIYGLDVTKTTMVNKVPIPAFSSTISMVKEKPVKSGRTLRVSQSNRRKFLNSLKAIKKPKALSPPSENNKENISEVAAKNNDITQPQSVDIETAFIDNKSPLLQMGNEQVTEKDSENVSKSSTQINNVNLEENKEILPANPSNVAPDDKSKEKPGRSFQIIEQTMEEKIKSISNNENNSSIHNQDCENARPIDKNNKDCSSMANSKELANNLKKLNDDGSVLLNLSNNNVYTDTNLLNSKECSPEKQKSSKNGSESNISKSDLMKDTKYSEILSNNFNQQSSNDPHNSNCKLQPVKMVQGNSVIANSEIPEDILATFGGPPEQTLPTSPLVSSPLATSPTAAFLLAFPLVCPGPRPDTPLNDNLQTPNICSLDNFSTFFSSKESAPTNNIISLNNSHNIFPDCQTKQSIQIPSDKGKPHWPHAESFTKPLLSEIDHSKYNVKVEICSRIPPTEKNIHEKVAVTTSSACAYSAGQTIFQNSKPLSTNNPYGLSDTLYSYNNLPSVPNQKSHINITKDTALNSKGQSNFESPSQNNITKNKVINENNEACNSIAPNYLDNNLSSVSCNNTKAYNYSTVPINSNNDSNSCKRNQPSDGSMRLVLPGVIPEYPSNSKPIDIPFSFQAQGKPMFPNSSNIYTSCNTYNPFSSDFSSNSMNLGIPCGNSIRTKPSTTYFSDFNSSNIYSQNCNVWPDDNQIDFDPSKIDYNRKLNLPISLNQNQPHGIVSDFQTDLRFSLPVISKCQSNKQNPIIDTKSSKNKCLNKDGKYQSPEVKSKTDYSNQKGPVNWMTSDGIGQQNNDIYFSNYKDIKHEQNSALPNVSQACLDPVSNLPGITSSLACKKTDLFEQPFFHIPPSGYVSQVVNEDNQFTWSPSKLNSFGDSQSLAPCSLPTLVGDLALGIVTESKLPYQIPSEQDSTVKERKNIPHKNKDLFVGKTNCSQNIELNSSQSTGNFFSVSQLVERGKVGANNVSNTVSCKSSIQDNQKRNNVESLDRLYNPQLPNINKPYEIIPIFPSDTFSSHDQSLMLSKDANFNSKSDSNSKNVNKNNYSTEALLQNTNVQYPSTRKHKQNNNMQKIYSETSNYPIPSNQFISSNHPLQFDNFPQNQQYASNTFPYTSSSVTMNSSFYSSSNFISSSNTMGTSNYIGSGFSSDLVEYQGNGADNVFYMPKMENCKTKMQSDVPETSKYPLNAKMAGSLKEINKNKIDVCTKKDSAPPSKRQKKHKNFYPSNCGISERWFGTLANQVNSPMGLDESFFGYTTTSQMHPYPAQSILPNLQPTGFNPQKNNFPIAKSNLPTNMSSSPNPVGTSLTNFNLSTIFPEMDKRPNMSGFNDSQHVAGNISKTTGMFH